MGMESIHEQAEQQRQQLLLQLEKQVKGLEVKLAGDYKQRVTETKQQFTKLRNVLEEQAIELMISNSRSEAKQLIQRAAQTADTAKQIVELQQREILDAQNDLALSALSRTVLAEDAI